MCVYIHIYMYREREKERGWARMVERRGVCRVLVGNPKGKRPLGRPRRRWEDNIKMDFHEVGWRHGLDWSASWQGQVSKHLNLRVTKNARNFLRSLEPGKTAIISPYSINWSVFITEKETVYCAVRTGTSYIIHVSFSGLWKVKCSEYQYHFRFCYCL